MANIWRLGKTSNFIKTRGMEMAKEMPIRINRVMELTGYSKSYIYKLVHWNLIPYYKPVSAKGRLLFMESEIIDFLSRNRQAPVYEVAERADAILNGEAR